MIKVENLTKTYKTGPMAVPALKGITFEIEHGEFAAITGPSGCGKSTLMHIIGGLDRQTSGKYFFEGAEVSRLSDDQLAKIRGQKVGFVFQVYNLLPRMDVFRNIEMPLIIGEVGKRERQRRVFEILEELGLTDKARYLHNELSGGQQQKVAIARALVKNPAVILADEPTGNLDTKSSEEIVSIFKTLNDRGVTVIMVTHNLQIAQELKRIISIRDGLMVGDTAVT